MGRSGKLHDLAEPKRGGLQARLRRVTEVAEITGDWKHDPGLKTEVEVRFIADGKNGTRVELEHRHLDAYGARRDEMRGIFDSEGGWSGLLASFARAAAA
jgi:uncharacterized protein YndB with AHSA1/START domain